MENVGPDGLAALLDAGLAAADALAAAELPGFAGAAAEGDAGAGELFDAVCAAPQPASSTAAPNALVRRNSRRENLMLMCSPPGRTSIPERIY